MNLLSREITLAEIPSIWPEAREYLRDAVEDRDPDSFLRDVQAKIFAGLHTLWRIVDEAGELVGYVVTTIYTSDGVTKIAQIYMASGNDLDLLVQEMDHYVEWADERGVHLIEIIGRKGWEKILAPYGFKHNYTSLMRRVREEYN